MKAKLLETTLSRGLPVKAISMMAAALTLISALPQSAYAAETTPYGKITGIETRDWGLHVNVDYALGASLGCPSSPGDVYMLDLHKDYVSINGGNFEAVQASVLSAFMAGREISFHLYTCRSSNDRPYVGHVRIR